MRDLYLLCNEIEERERNNASLGAGDVDLEDEEEDTRDGNQAISRQTSSTSSSSEDVMVMGCIDFILELLSIVSAQVKGSGKNRLGERSKGKASCGLIDLIALCESADSPYPASATASIKMFLEAAVHAAGILKSYSGREMDRKRLLHMGVMQTLSDNVETVVQVIIVLGRGERER
jgi:hypothetical protein